MRSLSVYGKYALYVKKYGSRKKVENLLLNRWEMANKKAQLRSFPYKYTIDPGNVCNLRCPNCQTGFKHPEMPKPTFTSPEQFIKVFDQIKDYALSVALYNNGEPFLNKDIFEMIAYANEQSVGTTIHSNFNYFSEEMAEKAVKSGLTHIYLSIDGASQEIYELYRVRGKLDKVIGNIQTLLRVRNELGSRYPIVTWKYLIFNHNVHELEAARKLAEKIGVDAFESFRGTEIPFDIYDEADYYLQRPNELSMKKKALCHSLWSSMYINSDGGVYPCSLAYRDTESFGSIHQQDIRDIWNGNLYQKARGLFARPTSNGQIPMPCAGCVQCLMWKPKQFHHVLSKTNRHQTGMC